jgi:hypothetical protein
MNVGPVSTGHTLTVEKWLAIKELAEFVGEAPEAYALECGYSELEVVAFVQEQLNAELKARQREKAAQRAKELEALKHKITEAINTKSTLYVEEFEYLELLKMPEFVPLDRYKTPLVSGEIGRIHGRSVVLKGGWTLNDLRSMSEASIKQEENLHELIGRIVP